MHSTNDKQFGLLYLSGLYIILMTGLIVSVVALALGYLLANCAKKRRDKRQIYEVANSSIDSTKEVQKIKS